MSARVEYLATLLQNSGYTKEEVVMSWNHAKLKEMANAVRDCTLYGCLTNFKPHQQNYSVRTPYGVVTNVGLPHILRGLHDGHLVVSVGEIVQRHDIQFPRVDHLRSCGNDGCLNPYHLFPATRREVQKACRLDGPAVNRNWANVIKLIGEMRNGT